jgi:hypothetical protein
MQTPIGHPNALTVAAAHGIPPTPTAQNTNPEPVC